MNATLHAFGSKYEIPPADKSLQTKVNFGRVSEKKTPESVNSGVYANPLDQARSEKNRTLNTSILSDAPNLYKQNGVSMSSNSNFLKLNRCEATFWLMANHPNAYLLLNLIALRAQRTPNHPSGLEIGEALVGDFESIGATRQNYRTALGVLTRMKYITICETCRTRKKSTTGSTTVGTKVKLLNSDIWDINPEYTNHPINHRPTTDQPPTNHEQECIKQQVVVVVSEKNEQVGVVEQKEIPPEMKFTKDDLYAASVRLRKDWSSQEIENAWIAYSNSKTKISSPFDYIEGIIKNKRTIAQSLKQKNKKEDKKSCQTKIEENQMKPCKEKLQSSESEISEKDTEKPRLVNLLSMINAQRK